MDYRDIKKELIELTNQAAAKLDKLTQIERAEWSTRTTEIDNALNPLLPRLAFHAYDPSFKELDPLLLRCLATLRSSCHSGNTSMGVYATLQLLFTVGTPMIALMQLDRVAKLLLEPRMFVELDEVTLGSHLTLEDMTGVVDEQIKILRAINDRVLPVLKKECFTEKFENAYAMFEVLFQIVNVRSLPTNRLTMWTTSAASATFKRLISLEFAPGGKRNDELDKLFPDYSGGWRRVSAVAQLPALEMASALS